MKIDDIRKNAYAMPYPSPAYSKGPFEFFGREFFIISYRTDPDLLRAVVPEPLTIKDPIVNFEFIRMPDSAGFGNYTESGQIIPVIDQDGKAGGSATSCSWMTKLPPPVAAKSGDSRKN